MESNHDQGGARSPHHNQLLAALGALGALTAPDHVAIYRRRAECCPVCASLTLVAAATTVALSFVASPRVLIELLRMVQELGGTMTPAQLETARAVPGVAVVRVEETAAPPAGKPS